MLLPINSLPGRILLFGDLSIGTFFRLVEQNDKPSGAIQMKIYETRDGENFVCLCGGGMGFIGKDTKCYVLAHGTLLEIVR